jgi:transcriptional antiterminator Rof (Rho-off)
MALIEEIITCSNMLFDYLELANQDKHRLKLIEKDNQSMYIKAYSELISYLRHLFVEYNKRVSEEDIQELLEYKMWGWAEFLKQAISCDKYEKVNIITYNYDIWLERLLDALNIEYNICGCQHEDKHVNIIKPHGSISFVHVSGKEVMYEINYNIDSTGADIDQVKTEYVDLEEYSKSYIIPPYDQTI